MAEDEEVANAELIQAEEIPDIDQIMALFHENMEELHNVKVMLVEYLEKQKKNQAKTWLSGREVQKTLNISKCTLRRYRNDGRIKYIRIKNTYRYLNSDVISTMADCK